LLITKNRAALDFKTQLIENHAVDVTEDSMLSDMLPHAKPPQSLSFIDPQTAASPLYIFDDNKASCMVPLRGSSCLLEKLK
jgi:hypothetical protein